MHCAVFQLHDLSLVSYESYDLVPSKTSEVHGIYNSILSLLRSVIHALGIHIYQLGYAIDF